MGLKKARAFALVGFTVLGTLADTNTLKANNTEMIEVEMNAPVAGVVVDLQEIMNDTEVADVEVKTIEVHENGTWNENYTVEEATLLASVVYAEARGCDDLHQQYVVSVVLNRVNSEEFPDTIYDVVYQNNPLQYACVENGQLDEALSLYSTKEVDEYTFEILEKCYENVEYVLTKGSLLPYDVVYQAEFRQGSGTYYISGNTYFCYR